MSKRRLFGWLILPDLRWLNRSVTFGTLLIAGAVCAGLAAIFITAGGVDVAANEPDGWLTRHLLHFTFKRSIATRSSEVVPPNDLADAGRVRLGARHYDMVCANCHGAPGLGQSAVALSMSPRPQHLPQVLAQFTDAELHRIVVDGVKFSAMPSWPAETRGDEVWSMVAFLKQLPGMDARTYLAMTAAGAPETTPDIPLGDTITPRPSDTRRNTPPVDEFNYAAPAIGFSDRTLRSHPLTVCAGCHGVDGDGVATAGEAPNLTIHDAAYLRRALDAYSSGARKSGFMQPIASQLSSEQIGQLADYYAQLPARATPPAAAPDAALVKRGEAIARDGIRETATPACANCHESAGSRISGAPRIAGQTETYLRRQLTAMRSGGRGGSGERWNPMTAEAHDLTDGDIAGLSAYYASLKPTKGTDAPLAAAAWPKGDLARGKELFDTLCSKCHLNGGRGDEAGLTPDITLQAAPYVAQQLHDFRARIRTSNKMLETTESITYDDMASVASYLNTLAPQPALAPFDKAAAARGARLAEHGDTTRDLPACTSCHSGDGVAALPLISRLQGQSAPYLRNRLDLFASELGTQISALNPMPAMAQKLTNDERADLAAYFAAAAPLPKPAAP